MEWRITQTYETMDLDIDYEYQRKPFKIILNGLEENYYYCAMLESTYLRRGVKS